MQVLSRRRNPAVIHAYELQAPPPHIQEELDEFSQGLDEDIQRYVSNPNKKKLN